MIILRTADGHYQRYPWLTSDGRSSFYEKGDTTAKQLMVYRENLVAKHLRTTFIAASVGIEYGHLACYPNLYDDTSASYKRLGRHPVSARRFRKYQDHIPFAGDIGGVLSTEIYQSMICVLETVDEYADHGQPRAELSSKIQGLYLPDQLLNAHQVIPAFQAMPTAAGGKAPS